MKKLILAGLLLSLGVGVHAQGTVNFQNSTSSRVTLPDGTPAPVGSLSLGLYYAPDNNSAFVMLGNSAGLLAPGIFIGGTRTTPTTTAGGASAIFEVKAWSSGYASYDLAAASGDSSAFIGATSSFSNPTGNPGAQPPGTPASLSGFTGLQVSAVQAVPEPATILLGLLGAGALFIRRRK
jgi:hypothetical protein